MEWEDKGVILSTRAHGESSVVVELLTKKHGRHSGLVRGGQSRKKKALLQTGNHVLASWKARLSEHLGTYTLELDKSFSATLLSDRTALSGISTLSALAHLLPEREPHEGLYQSCLVIFEHIDNEEIWPLLLVRWELALLNELGFGLDLSQCTATGNKEQLKYVSPKTGRAVSLTAGEPYKDKLLLLPSFLIRSRDNSYSKEELYTGFELTGFFLDKYIFKPKGQMLPDARSRLVKYLK